MTKEPAQAMTARSDEVTGDDDTGDDGTGDDDAGDDGTDSGSEGETGSSETEPPDDRPTEPQGPDQPGQEPIDWGTIDTLVNQHGQEGEPGESGPGALGGGRTEPQSPNYGGREPEPEPGGESEVYPPTYPPQYPYPPEGYPPPGGEGETFQPPSWTELVPPGGHGTGKSSKPGSTQRGAKKCPTGCHERPDGKGCHCPDNNQSQSGGSSSGKKPGG